MTAESGDKNFSKLGDETLIGRRKVEKKAVENIAAFGNGQALRRKSDVETAVESRLNDLCRSLYGEVSDEMMKRLRSKMADYTDCRSFKTKKKYLPKNRQHLLKMGLFLGLSIGDMNWVLSKRKQRELNSRGLQDMVWIYLLTHRDGIADNARTGEEEFNEFYGRAKDAYAQQSDSELNDNAGEKDPNKTIVLQHKIIEMKDDRIEDFIEKHYQDLKLFYKKPQTYLKSCLSILVEFDRRYDITTKETYRKGKEVKEIVCQIKASSNRYVDEGYINTGIRDYLEMDRFVESADITKSGVIPQTRDKYICMGLCFGCSKNELDDLLRMAGYAELSPAEGINESTLIGVLNDWDRNHQEAVLFRNNFFPNIDASGALKCRDISELDSLEKNDAYVTRKTIEDLLSLKNEVRRKFQMEGENFSMDISFEPYEHITGKADFIEIEDVIQHLLEKENIPPSDKSRDLKKAYRYGKGSTLYKFEKNGKSIILYTCRLGKNKNVFTTKFNKDKYEILNEAGKGIVAFRIETGECIMLYWETICKCFEQVNPRTSESVGDYWQIEILKGDNGFESVYIKGTSDTFKKWQYKQADNIWT